MGDEPVIADGLRVEIAKLELQPGDLLFVKADLEPVQARALMDSFANALEWMGKEEIAVMAGPFDVTVIDLPDEWLDALADKVEERLERRQRAGREPTPWHQR